jgi:hypothetical protein
MAGPEAFAAATRDWIADRNRRCVTRTTCESEPCSNSRAPYPMLKKRTGHDETDPVLANDKVLWPTAPRC